MFGSFGINLHSAASAHLAQEEQTKPSCQRHLPHEGKPLPPKSNLKTLPHQMFDMGSGKAERQDEGFRRDN
ncbi:hypothetical protein DSO57_1000598 [Entomophthora muscae]|uniref:Uncharacterized protein n=1 Tax=Entomophthora muscae TaxID=34485 RepID=A0ACC2S0B4_9FUNG|nr:hypothetical protein DSO57_1000598 [Entomophthora muscae]